MLTDPWTIGVITSVVGGIVVAIIISRRFRQWLFKYGLWPVWVHRRLLDVMQRVDSLEEGSAKPFLPTKKIRRDWIVIDLGLIWYTGPDMNQGPYCQICYQSGQFILISVNHSNNKSFFYCSQHEKHMGPAKQLDYALVEQKIKNLRQENITRTGAIQN